MTRSYEIVSQDKKRSTALMAALASFLLFAALLGVSRADASLPKATDVADLSRQALQLPAAASIEPSRFGFADDLGLLNVEKEAPRFSLIEGVKTRRFERTYARNNPLKYVDPDGHQAAPPQAVSETASVLFSFIPVAGDVQDAIRAVSGYDPITAASLSTTERVISGVAAVIPFVGGAVLSKAARIGENATQGASFEAKVVGQLGGTQTHVVQQITVKTASGTKTRIDAAGRAAGGEVALTEAKSSATARLTPNQKAAFPEIAESGATVVGQGKPGLPGGTTIPPTNVRIVRPEDLNP